MGRKPVSVNNFAHFRVNEVVERIDVLANKASDLKQRQSARSCSQYGEYDCGIGVRGSRTLRNAGRRRHFSSTELKGITSRAIQVELVVVGNFKMQNKKEMQYGT